MGWAALCQFPASCSSLGSDTEFSYTPTLQLLCLPKSKMSNFSLLECCFSQSMIAAKSPGTGPAISASWARSGLSSCSQDLAPCWYFGVLYPPPFLEHRTFQRLHPRASRVLCCVSHRKQPKKCKYCLSHQQNLWKIKLCHPSATAASEDPRVSHQIQALPASRKSQKRCQWVDSCREQQD